MPETHEKTSKFRTLVGDSEASLDRLALTVASHAVPDTDIEFEIERLDDLAADYLDSFTKHSHESLSRYLFADRYVGDNETYYDPANSMLHQVLDRGVGLPITLSILAIEVGRRCGLPFVGVGMPSHFLIRHATDATRFFDPFWGGIELTGADCRDRLEESIPSIEWNPSLLAPVSPLQIVERMLANLALCYSNPYSPTDLTWVLELRAALPGASPGVRRRLADALVGSGRFDDAADLFDELDSNARSGDQSAGEYAAAATRLRARLN